MAGKKSGHPLRFEPEQMAVCLLNVNDFIIRLLMEV